jgi:hypothetical protein
MALNEDLELTRRNKNSLSCRRQLAVSLLRHCLLLQRLCRWRQR